MSPDLPPEAERGALMDGLDELIELRGAEALLRWSVLLCTPQYFPDTWSADVEGVAAMARRILHHAGLGALRIAVDLYDANSAVEYQAGVGGIQTRKLEEAVVSFRGLSEGVCHFDVAPDQLDDPELVAGALAGEIARVYRSFHGLTTDDQAHEEQLTELTTVFLGLGVLRANVGDRRRLLGRFS